MSNPLKPGLYDQPITCEIAPHLQGAPTRVEPLDPGDSAVALADQASAVWMGAAGAGG